MYTRLSPNPKKEDTINQERDLKEFAERSKWEVVEIYTDINVSGTKKGIDRPQFKRMMADASKRRFDILLFWSLDRLSREGVYETHGYLKQLSNYGVEWKSFTEQYFDSLGMFKDAIISIMATLAKQERVRIVERTKAGLQTARDRGIVLGRPKVKVTIRDIDSLRTLGRSQREISKELKISPATVSRMIKEGKQYA